MAIEQFTRYKADMRAVAVVASAVISAKLVIATANGVTVTDYPTMDRCERARAELVKGWTDAAKERMPSGYHLVAPPTLTAVCIPA